MVVTVNLPVGVFNALFFVIHEFIALSIIGILIDTFNNRRIRQKLSLGQPAVIRRTGFFHIYSSNIRSWTAFVGIIMMVIVWISVPVTELGISSATLFNLQKKSMVHLVYAKDNKHQVLTFGETIDDRFLDKQTVPTYNFNTFLYAATKCSKALTTKNGENIGKEYFDMYLPAVPNNTMSDSPKGVVYNQIMSTAARDPPEFACQDGEGGREVKQIAKVYQVTSKKFDSKTFNSDGEDDGWVLITGKWNSSHTIHTYVKQNNPNTNRVCIIGEKKLAQVLTSDTATIESGNKIGEFKITPGSRRLGYKVFTTIPPEDVCRHVAQSPFRPNGETPDDLFGATAYPTSALALDTVKVTKGSYTATQVSNWAFVVYLGTTFLVIILCLIGILTTRSGAKSIPAIVTRYDGIVQLLSNERRQDADIDRESDASHTLGTSLEQAVEIRHEAGVMYLAAKKRNRDVEVGPNWDGFNVGRS